MIALPRFGLCPAGYAARRTLASMSSGEDPLIAGPSGPSFDGSLLWQAMHWAR